MSRLIVPIALVLALATGAALAETRMAFEPAPVVARPDERVANTDLVRRWYGAVNRAIRTGDASGLTVLMAPDFVAHAGWAEDTGSAALAAYVVGLHATHPRAQLVVLDVTAEDDRVVARVRVAGAARAQFLGMPIASARIWGTSDVFRVADGEIAEHWGDGQPLARFAPLLTVSVPGQTSGGTIVALERQTYPPGRSTSIGTFNGFAIILVETGELRFDLHDRLGGSAWHRRQSPTEPASPPIPLAPGIAAVLQTGDALVVGDGAVGALGNDGAPVAVALVVSVAGTDGQSAFDGRHLGAASGAAASQVATPNAAAVAVDLLAGGLTVELPGGEIVVAIGRATLPAPGGVARHTAAGVELLSVEAGGVVLATGTGGAWVRRGEGVRASHLETALLAAGEGALLQRGVEVLCRSVDDDPLELLLVTIVPAAPGADTTRSRATTGHPDPIPQGT